MSNSQDTYLIGLDLGTSAMKGVLVESHGPILCQASRPVELLRLADQRAELDPEQYVQDVCALLRELVSHAEDPAAIKAISVSGASGNTVLLDDDCRPLGNAISWLDNRCAGMADDLWPGLDSARVYRSAGWPFAGSFPLAHLAWHKAKSPDLWRQTRSFAMLHDYVYHQLCGRLVVDHSKASSFYLQDQETRSWNRELLSFLEIEASQLSELLPPGMPCGELTTDALQATGLAPGTQVVTGSFDHPSAARSTGIFEEGDLLISAGTSWVVFSPIRNRELGLKGGMLLDPFLSPTGCWGAMFSLTAVAEKLHAFLDRCIPAPPRESAFARFNRLASEAPPGADGLVINLFHQSCEERMAPATPQNIARALMEGIVFRTRARVDELSQLTGTRPGRIVLTGGPTRSPVWPSILADVLNRPVVLPETGEHAGAMGAAILAGIGIGRYRNEQDGYAALQSPDRVVGSERAVTPDPVRSSQYQELYRDYTARFAPGPGVPIES